MKGDREMGSIRLTWFKSKVEVPPGLKYLIPWKKYLIANIYFAVKKIGQLRNWFWDNRDQHPIWFPRRTKM